MVVRHPPGVPPDTAKITWPRLFLRRAVKIADWLFFRLLLRKNITAAIFTAIVAVKIAAMLFLRQESP